MMFSLIRFSCSIITVLLSCSAVAAGLEETMNPTQSSSATKSSTMQTMDAQKQQQGQQFPQVQSQGSTTQQQSSPLQPQGSTAQQGSKAAQPQPSPMQPQGQPQGSTTQQNLAPQPQISGQNDGNNPGQAVNDNGSADVNKIQSPSGGKSDSDDDFFYDPSQASDQ